VLLQLALLALQIDLVLYLGMRLKKPRSQLSIHITMDTCHLNIQEAVAEANLLLTPAEILALHHNGEHTNLDNVIFHHKEEIVGLNVEALIKRFYLNFCWLEAAEEAQDPNFMVQVGWGLQEDGQAAQVEVVSKQEPGLQEKVWYTL
jgi:hypothetical protein